MMVSDRLNVHDEVSFVSDTRVRAHTPAVQKGGYFSVSGVDEAGGQNRSGCWGCNGGPPGPCGVAEPSRVTQRRGRSPRVSRSPRKHRDNDSVSLGRSLVPSGHFSFIIRFFRDFTLILLMNLKIRLM